MPRPRHRADHDTVTPAAHPRRLSLNERERRSKIERAPAPASLPEIETRRAAPADTTAIPLAPARPGAHDHLALAADPHVLNHRPLQPKQPRPYPDTAHVASPPRDSSRQEAGNPRSRAACAPSQPLTPPTETSGAPQKGGEHRCRWSLPPWGAGREEVVRLVLRGLAAGLVQVELIEIRGCPVGVEIHGAR